MSQAVRWCLATPLKHTAQCQVRLLKLYESKRKFKFSRTKKSPFSSDRHSIEHATTQYACTQTDLVTVAAFTGVVGLGRSWKFLNTNLA
jgi:hypothetical protein